MATDGQGFSVFFEVYSIPSFGEHALCGWLLSEQPGVGAHIRKTSTGFCSTTNHISWKAVIIAF